jgi:hypothetical protein
VNKNEINFPLNSTEKMIFDFEDDLNDIDYCYEVPVFFDLGLQKIILAHVFVYDAMQKLSNSLQLALKNELLLHESIKRDIGYVYNEYSCNELLQNSSQFVEIYSNDRSFWVGYTYYVWSSCLRNVSCVTWIYNDVKGDIVFEVTPLYVACDSEEPSYVPYDEWLKSYKPYLVRKLSKETVQQWLGQAQYVMSQIDNNIARWKQEDFKIREK